jgi:Spy/CpxP family protein refolding chaperone
MIEPASGDKAMKAKMTILTLVVSLCSCVAMAQDRPRPDQPPPRQRQGRDNAQRYSIEQALSDKAQLHTIAFDGLAFLTGDFGLDTFLPPGKVSDYFGFQYMRDIDAKEGGHNTSFLTRIAYNMLSILNEGQKAQLLALGKRQQDDIRRFAEMRLPLIKAFRRNLEVPEGLPAGSKGLDKAAVVKHSAELYELDGLLAYQRAEVMGGIIRLLDDSQKAALAKLKFGDSRTWPDVPEPLDRRSMSHDVNVAVMTYASEMFAWYAGSLEADTYFCPERHGMYFGGFGMKTAPAMGKQDYSISTSLTGDSGEAFLAALTDAQRKRITDLVDLQRKDLAEIVKTRRAIATELRRFQNGQAADKDKVLSLSRRYGELDGEMSYLYATAFAQVGRTLSAGQKEKLATLRTTNPSDPKGPFLYSTPIKMPKIENTDFLFGAKPRAASAPVPNPGS